MKFSTYNRYSSSTLVLMTVLALFSCKKYLDKKTNSSLVVPTTLSDLQAILDNADKLNFNTSSYALSSADEYIMDEAMFSTLGDDRKAYIWLPFDYVWQNDWSTAYSAIYNSNVCLEQVENVEKNQKNTLTWNNVKGSALFFRAYHFQTLVWAHAKAYDEQTAQTDLGLPLRLQSDFNIPSVRATVKETYDQILSDGKQAATLLENNPQHPIRPSKAAAYGLVARTYLSMRNYDSALYYADLCLSIKNDLMDFNTSTEINIDDYFPFNQFNSETIFYSQSFGSFMYLHYDWMGSYLDTALFRSYDDNDLRKTLFYFPSYNGQTFRGSYVKDGNLFSGIATDEMYLTRAESYAHRDEPGDIDAAMNDLNLLLSKRFIDGTFIPLTAGNAAEAQEIIFQERRKELVFRGLRWIDIKRHNKEGANLTLERVIEGQSYTLPPNDDRYALPLPKDIVEQSGIKQN